LGVESPEDRGRAKGANDIADKAQIRVETLGEPDADKEQNQSHVKGREDGIAQKETAARNRGESLAGASQEEASEVLQGFSERLEGADAEVGDFQVVAEEVIAVESEEGVEVEEDAAQSSGNGHSREDLEEDAACGGGGVEPEGMGGEGGVGFEESAFRS